MEQVTERVARLEQHQAEQQLSVMANYASVLEAKTLAKVELMMKEVTSKLVEVQVQVASRVASRRTEGEGGQGGDKGQEVDYYSEVDKRLLRFEALLHSSISELQGVNGDAAELDRYGGAPNDLACCPPQQR